MELRSLRQGGELRHHELRVRPIPNGANGIQRDWSRANPNDRPDAGTYATANGEAHPNAEANPNPDASAAAGSAALAAGPAAVRRVATCSRAGADEAALLAGSEPHARADLE